MEYEFIRTAEARKELGTLRRDKAIAYNPVNHFENCVYGEVSVDDPNKQEIIADTAKGKVLLTTDISSFRKNLEDLVSGALQEDMKKQHNSLFNSGLVKAILTEHPEYVIPAKATRKEILERFDTPDIRKIIEDFRENLDTRKRYVDFLAVVWDDAKSRLEKFLKNENGGRKLYNTLESATYSYEQLKKAISILETKRKGLEIILKVPGKLDNAQTLKLQEYLGIINTIHSRLATLDSINQNDFPYFNLKQYFDLGKTAEIKTEEARSFLDSFNGACKYYSDNCVVGIYKKFGKYAKDVKPDTLILPFDAGTTFYLGSTKNKNHLLKINGDYGKEFMDKVFNIIVTHK